MATSRIVRLNESGVIPSHLLGLPPVGPVATATVTNRLWVSPAIDTTTGAIAAAGHGMADGTLVAFVPLAIHGADFPGGIYPLRAYYVVNSAADTLQVSLTAGGSVVPITTAGTVGRWRLEAAGTSDLVLDIPGDDLAEARIALTGNMMSDNSTSTRLFYIGFNNIPMSGSRYYPMPDAGISPAIPATYGLLNFNMEMRTKVHEGQFRAIYQIGTVITGTALPMAPTYSNTVGSGGTTAAAGTRSAITRVSVSNRTGPFLHGSTLAAYRA